MKAGTLILVLILILIGSGYLLSEYRDTRQEVGSLQNQVDALQRENATLREQNQTLQLDLNTAQTRASQCNEQLQSVTLLNAGLPADLNPDLLIGLWIIALAAGGVTVLVLIARRIR